ncbi:choline/carnitine O-acyltransferase [Calditrichota bacterium LG25]
MASSKRSQLIYERHADYEIPPLIPLLPIEELYHLEELKLRSNAATRTLIKFVFQLSGLTHFYLRLQKNLEQILQSTNMRGRALYLPVVSATLALTDDPQKNSLLERSASLIRACRSFYSDICSGKLEQDRWKGKPLEMGQYPNFFATNVVVEGKRIDLFKSPHDHQLLVMIKNHTYLIEIENWRDAQFDFKFQKTLQQIAEQCATGGEPVGLLSAPASLTQIKIFKELRKNSENLQNLERLQHVFVTLCLEPDLYPRTTEEAYRLAHSANFSNRWWHSSLQIVVFGNGKSCLIGNFSAYLDGNVMMRGAAEIQKRARQIQVQILPPSFDQSFPFKKLNWRVPKKLYQLAQKDLQRIKDRNQQSVFELKVAGSAFFKERKIPSIPVFVIALHATIKQFTGRHPNIHQFVSLSHYRCMDLTTVNVSTAQVKAFVEQFNNRQLSSPALYAKLMDAVRSQKEITARRRQYLSFADILTLFFLNASPIKRNWARVLILFALRLLKSLHLLTLEKREVLISHPALRPEVPLVGRPGIRLPYVKYLGLHYQIWPEKIVITYMPAIHWSVSNESFTQKLEANLRRLKELIASATQFSS